MTKLRCGYLRLISTILVLVGSLYGQLTAGEIRIAVKDPSGVGMAVSGTLQSFSAGIQRSFETDSMGMHVFGALPFGVYRLEMHREGFANQSVLIEVRSGIPTFREITMAVAPVESSVRITSEQTLLDTGSTGAAQHLGADALHYRASSMPGRSVIDVVNRQPGWLLEANGILHPRGSEYDVQYVVDGIPLYDNRSPAFAQSLGTDEFETVTVRTANYPAEFGRKLGGVIEVNTEHDARKGFHGRAVLQGATFGERSGFASMQYAAGRNSFSLSGEGMKTDRYLDPPVEENFTNRGSGGSMSARFARSWSDSDKSQVHFDSHRTGFLVPNEMLQQIAGQRQDRTARETLGQFSHTHLFSPRILLQARAMVRDTSARLWSNAASTPIRPAQDRGFREGYAAGSLSIVRGAHEFKAGGDVLFRSIRENFGYQIVTRRISNVRIFDGGLPSTFRFDQRGVNREQSFFAQDLWRYARLTVGAGLRFDRYSLNVNETAWSPRLGISYYFPRADFVLRASYDRVFEEPAVENILLATTNLVDALGGEGVFLPLLPGRGNFVETGFSKRLFNQLRLDATWYHRQLDHFADDALLLNTGVSFPVAFREGKVTGYEAKLDLPRWGRLSWSASYTNMTATGFFPVSGGLLLGDNADEALRSDGSFPITQDQRNTWRSYLRVQATRRAWFAVGGSYNSGLPFEIEGPANVGFLAEQYGSRIIGKVNFERGRVRPSASLDASVGFIITESDRSYVRLQADAFNFGNRLNLINFSGILSGTALEAGRRYAVQLSVGF